jgi:hypothetical protein
MVKVDKIESNLSIFRAANRDLAAAAPQRFERRFKHWAADCVQGQIDTLSAGKRANCLSKITGRGINDCICFGRIVRMSGRANHARFLPMCDLCRGAADSAAHTNDQNGFTLLNIADAHKRRPGGQIRNANRRGLLHR